MNFEDSLTAWLAALQARIDAYYQRAYEHVEPPKLETMPGPKFVRVITARNDSEGRPLERAAYCFVERATGNIFKPAGWKGPEKNFPRGNIYEAIEKALAWCTPHGLATAH